MTINPISHRPRFALLTGGSGFIGSNLARVLIEEGVRCRVLALPDDEAKNLNGLDVEIVRGDLRDPESLARAVAGCDTVYHLGAIFDYWLPRPRDMFEVNVEGTVNMARAARGAGVKRFVHCSSVAALGTLPGEQQADETTTFNNWDTADDYVLSKYIGEAEAFRVASTQGPPMDVVAGLPCFPFGRNDINPTPTGMLAQRYISGENPIIFTGGLNCANVRDIAQGFHLCATRGRPGERYILGGENVTYTQLAHLLCTAAGSKIPSITISPARLAWLGRINEWFANLTGVKPYFAYKATLYLADRYFYFDISKSRRELGYLPGPLSQACEEAARWFIDEHARVLAGEVVHPATPKTSQPPPPQPVVQA